jgi:antitoxin PrlF
MKSAMDVKGRVTIPKVVRQHLGLKPGNRIKFFLHPDGHVVLLPTLPSSALRGMVKRRRLRSVTLEEMEAAGPASVARPFVRRLRSRRSSDL